MNFYDLENSEGDKIDFSIDKEALYLIIFYEPKKRWLDSIQNIVYENSKIISGRVRFLQT